MQDANWFFSGNEGERRQGRIVSTGMIEDCVPGAKAPHSCDDSGVRDKALTYLRGKGNGRVLGHSAVLRKLVVFIQLLRLGWSVLLALVRLLVNPFIRPLFRPVTLALALSLLVLPQGCKKHDDAAEAAKPAVAVQAEHPETGAITEQIEADATLAPVAQAAIQAKITAPIKALLVQRGSHVAAGQLVATLEDQDLAAATMDNQGAFTAAKATYTAATESAIPEDETKARLDLQQAKATLDLDKSITAARQQLFAQGAIPGRDVDTAKAAQLQAQAAFEIASQHYEAMKKAGHAAAIDSAKGNLQSAQGKLLGAQAELSYTRLRSPIRGVVTDRPLFVGETAAAGTAVVTVMDTSSLIAKIHLAQAQVQQLALGAKATLTIVGVDGPVPATVSLISPALDPGSTTVEVWLKVDNAKGRLMPGTAAHATIQGRTVQHALLIPTEAVQRSTEGAGKVVMVVDADGTAKRRSVTVGIANSESTQILDGLRPGDTVITTGGYGLDEGTKVTIVAAGTKKDEDDKSGEKP